MRRYLIFAVASTGILLSTIDATAVAVAFPEIVSSFDVSLVLAGWVLSSYQLAAMAILPISGKISDALGRKVSFLGFLSLFTVGSLLCSIAPNVPSLIAFRVIQGLGGSGFMPSATGIAADEFPRSRQQAVGLLSSIFPIGWVLGPNLGGWLTTVLGWRAIFWMNIPLCIIALVAAALLLPRTEKRKSHIDLVGAGLIAGALFSLMTGISLTGSTDGQPPWAQVGLLLSASLGSLIFFWRRQTRVKDPIIEPALLREKPFMAANVYNFLFGYAVHALSLVPLYAVSIYGMSTLESGLIVTPRSVFMIAASSVTSLALVRWGYRWPMLLGTVAIVPVFGLLAWEPASFGALGSSTVFLLIVMGLMGLAQGMASPAANNACLELMPHRIATITAMRVMFRQAGGAFSITMGSLALHDFGITRGFQIFFVGLAAVILFIMTPTIFAMPRSPTDVPTTKDSPGNPVQGGHQVGQVKKKTG